MEAFHASVVRELVNRHARLDAFDHFAADAVVRQVSAPGLICWRKAKVRVGHGLIGQPVRVEEDEYGVTIYYATHPVRRLRPEQLAKDHVV